MSGDQPAHGGHPHLQGVDDRDLLTRHVQGSTDAFDELVRRHRDRLWAVALRTLGDREEAADAVQDALVSAFRNAGAYRGDAAVTTWLHRIVVNACIDRVRRRTSRPTVPMTDEDVAGPDPFPTSDTGMAVRAALAELPPEQRAALVLVDMYGWSVEDAAGALDCAVGTVKSRCARGRARLLPLLAPVEPGNPSAVPGVRPGTSTQASVADRSVADASIAAQTPTATPGEEVSGQ